MGAGTVPSDSLGGNKNVLIIGFDLLQGDRSALTESGSDDIPEDQLFFDVGPQVDLLEPEFLESLPKILRTKRQDESIHGRRDLLASGRGLFPGEIDDELLLHKPVSQALQGPGLLIAGIEPEAVRDPQVDPGDDPLVDDGRNTVLDLKSGGRDEARDQHQQRHPDLLYHVLRTYSRS